MCARLFAIDLRSLAAARMVLGLVLLLDLLERCGDLPALYADDGALPLAIVRNHYAEAWRWSLHWLHPSLLYQGTLLGIAVLAAGGVAVGAVTRVATVASWLLLVSLHHRLPIVNNAGDDLLSLLLFWSMFLPWGERWSVDAWWRWRKAIPSAAVRWQPSSALSVASGAILLQMALMYALCGYFKLRPIWQSGAALQYVLAFDAYGRPAARWLSLFPHLLYGLSLATLWLEVIGPWLLFSPWFTGVIRLVVCSMLFAMHAGIAATLTVGWFSYVCMGGLLLFLPSTFWKWVGRLAGERFHTKTVVRDHGEGTATERNSVWQRAGRVASTVVCTVTLLLIVAWNISTLFPVGSPLRQAFPRPLAATLSAAGLTQRWDMFSQPPLDDEWVTASARLANGQWRDLWTGGNARDPFQSPDDPAGMFPNHRWRKLFRRLPRDPYESFRAPIGQWLVRRWNQSHPPSQQVTYFTLDYTRDRIQVGDQLARTLVTRLFTMGDPW